jgi:sugar phosphate isomerase/epimerase
MPEMFSSSHLHYAELSISHSADLVAQSPAQWQKFRQECEDLGLYFRQGHLRNQIDIATCDRQKSQEILELLYRWLEMYETLGITAGVIHPGGWDALYQGVETARMQAARAELLGKLASFTASMQVTVCLENIPDTAPDYASLQEMLDQAPAGSRLGVCLDTGHLNLTTADPGNFIRQAGPKLLALHLNDNCGAQDRPRDAQGYWYPDDLHLLPYWGKRAVNWKEVFTALQEVNYQGLLNFEIPGAVGGASPAIRRATCRWVPELTAALLEL